MKCLNMREFQVFCYIYICDRLSEFRCKFKQWNQEIGQMLDKGK